MKDYRPPHASLIFHLSHQRFPEGSVLIPDHIVDAFNSKVLRRADPNACWPYFPRFKRHYDEHGRLKTPEPNRWFMTTWTEGGGFQNGIPTHRLALLQEIGPAPLVGRYALHRCTLRGCMNPAHLYPGTQQQNIHDRFLMEEIERRTGSTDGVVLPLHPVNGLRSRIVCEEFISELKAQRMRARLDPPTRSLSIGPFRGASVPLPSPRLRPARERTAQIR